MTQPAGPTPEPGAREFAHELAEAIESRGLTLQAISARLAAQGTPASVPTLSYWQTGRSRPTRQRSLRAVETLETILDLPAGRLLATLGRSDAVWRAINVVSNADHLTTTAAKLGMTLERHFDAISAESQLTVGPDRLPRGLQSTRVLRCIRDETDRYPLLYRHIDSGPPVVTANFGCRIGQQHTLDEEWFTATELLLPRPMNRGEEHLVQYTIEWPECRAASERLMSSTTQHTMQLVLGVTFECPPPRFVHHREWLADSDEMVDVSTIEVVDGRVGLVLLDPPPGLHQLEWQWETTDGRRAGAQAP